jgi:hypothetical protein
MQIALRKITRNFHPCLKQAVIARTHLPTFSKGTLKVPTLRKEHANSMELLKRASFGFVSLAVPFKKQRSRPNVEEFLNAHNLEYKTTDTGYILKYCSFCSKPHKDDPSNLYRINIDH